MLFCPSISPQAFAAGGRGRAGSGGRRGTARGSWSFQGLKKNTVIVVGFTFEGSLWPASITNCLGTGSMEPDPRVCPGVGGGIY